MQSQEEKRGFQKRNEQQQKADTLFTVATTVIKYQFSVVVRFVSGNHEKKFGTPEMM